MDYHFEDEVVLVTRVVIVLSLFALMHIVVNFEEMFDGSGLFKLARRIHLNAQPASGSGSGSNEAGIHFEGRSKLARDSVALFSRICSAIFIPS